MKNKFTDIRNIYENIFQIISILQDLNSNNKTEISEADDSDSERRFSLEAAAFCKDPTFPVAATGVIDYEDSNKGRIYIWDVSRQVIFFTSL